MNKKFKTIQEIIDYTISDITQYISPNEIKNADNNHNITLQEQCNSILLNFIDKNKYIIFIDIIYDLYKKYLNIYPAEILFNPNGEIFKTVSNAHLYSNKGWYYSPNEKKDNTNEKITTEKNIVIGNYNVCPKKTYDTVQRKIKDTDTFINCDLYQKRRLMGIISSVYSNTEYNKPFAAEIKNIKKLYKSLSNLFNVAQNISELTEILNNPYNIYLLENIFKTERMYFLYNLSKNKDEISQKDLSIFMNNHNLLVNGFFRLTSYNLIDMLFLQHVSLAQQCNESIVENKVEGYKFTAASLPYVLITDLLPKMYNTFTENYTKNFGIDSIEDKFIHEIINIFKNHYNYLKKNILSNKYLNNFLDLLNDKHSSNTTEKTEIPEKVFDIVNNDIFVVFEREEEKLTEQTDTLYNYTKQLFNLIEKEKNLYTNIEFKKLVCKIIKNIEKKLKAINYIQSFIYDIFIKGIIPDIKPDNISCKDNTYLSYNKMNQLQDDFEKIPEYKILIKKFYSFRRDKKYKDAIKNIKDILNIFGNFINLYNELEKMKKMLYIVDLYKTKLLDDYIYSEKIINIATEKYKSVVEKYKIFADDKIYRNIYPPAFIYLYLNPNKSKELGNYKQDYPYCNTNLDISNVYGNFLVSEMNRKYFKNSKVKYSLDNPFM